MRWKPNVTVAAISQRDDRFLVVEEKDKKEIVFNQPAGHLEKGESLLEAVQREVMEETAWAYEPESIVGLYLYPSPRVDITYLRICFAGSCTEHFSDHQLDKGIIRATWLTREELEARKERLRSTMVLRCIDDFLAGKRYPLDLLNHQLL